MHKNFMILVVFVFGINSLILIDKIVSSQIPDQLQISSGILSVKLSGRDEYLTISNEQGVTVLSCSLGVTGTTRCFSAERLKSLTGKSLTARWYRQSIYSGIKKNKLASLDDGENQILDLERTKHLDRANIKITAVLASIIMSIVFFVVFMILRRQGSDHGLPSP